MHKEIKPNKSPKVPQLQNTFISIYAFIFFYTNFRALQILPPLQEISSSRFVRKGYRKSGLQFSFQFLIILKIKSLYFFICEWLGKHGCPYV
jgi:hypothetical protein